jgi:hypothetical protein
MFNHYKPLAFMTFFTLETCTIKISIFDMMVTLAITSVSYNFHQ